MQQVERVLAPDVVRHRLDRRRIREIATGGEARQQEVQADEVDQHRDVGGGVPHAGRHDRGQRDAVVGVVTRAALAQVVQERADQQEVGPTDPTHAFARACHRLQEVPVDGEAVERVALRPEPHRVPLGQELHQQSVLVEELELRHRGVAAAQQRDEGVAGVVAPRDR